MKYFVIILLYKYMQEDSFAWLKSKIEKILTEDKFENYWYFVKYYSCQVIT